MINTITLPKSFGYQTGYVVMNGIISFALDLIDLFALNQILATHRWCQCFLHWQGTGWSRSHVPILRWPCEL
jgi:hypothetical protein